MSFLRKLLSLASSPPPEAEELTPFIMDREYLNEVDFILTADPLISSDDFGDFITMFGLDPFEDFIEALSKKGSCRTLYHPDVTTVKKANGHDPLAICLSFHETSPLILFSLFGPITEMHAVLKAPFQSGVFQLDHLCIIDGNNLHEISCGEADGNLDILNRMLAHFALGVQNICEDKHSAKIDSERELWRKLKPEIDALNAFYLRKSAENSNDPAILPPACG